MGKTYTKAQKKAAPKKWDRKKREIKESDKES